MTSNAQPEVPAPALNNSPPPVLPPPSHTRAPSDARTRFVVGAMLTVSEDPAQEPAWSCDMIMCAQRIYAADMSFAELLAMPDVVTQCWWALKHFCPPPCDAAECDLVRAVVAATFQRDNGEFADACNGEVY